MLRYILSTGSRRAVGAWIFVLVTRPLVARAGEPCHYTYTEIARIPGWALVPKAMNDVGVVVGEAFQGGGESYRGFIWSQAEGSRLIPMPPGSNSLRPADINNQGVVVGQVTLTGPTRYRPFIWDGAAFTLIDPPTGMHQGFATAVNNLGQVVGNFNFSGAASCFLWEAGVFTDLTPYMASISSEVADINDRGQIFGSTAVVTLTFGVRGT